MVSAPRQQTGQVNRNCHVAWTRQGAWRCGDSRTVIGRQAILEGNRYRIAVGVDLTIQSGPRGRDVANWQGKVV